MSHPSVKISLRPRHAQTNKDCASSHKIAYVDIFPEIINLEGHLNWFIGLKAMLFLVNWGILPAGGVASGRVCACSRLVSYLISHKKVSKIAKGQYIQDLHPKWVTTSL